MRSKQTVRCAEYVSLHDAERMFTLPSRVSCERALFWWLCSDDTIRIAVCQTGEKPLERVQAMTHTEGLVVVEMVRRAVDVSRLQQSDLRPILSRYHKEEPFISGLKTRGFLARSL
jgi:hypothetical protein